MANKEAEVPANEQETEPETTDEGSKSLDRMLQNARLASDFLKALSHETRLLLLCLLSDGERSVTDLENALSLRQPTISQQLARLRTRWSRDDQKRRKDCVLQHCGRRHKAGHRPP